MLILKLLSSQHRFKASQLREVFSGVVTQADSDELTQERAAPNWLQTSGKCRQQLINLLQEMLAAMMREADTSNPTPKSPGATLLDAPEEADRAGGFSCPRQSICFAGFAFLERSVGRPSIGRHRSIVLHNPLIR